VNDATKPERPATGVASLRHRDFSLFLIGRNINNGSNHMMLVAIGYQLYELTGDPMNLAYIGLTMFGPSIAFSLLTGYVADMFDRRTVLVLVFCLTMTAGALFFFLTRAGIETVWPIYGSLLLLGTARAFASAASQSYVTNLVPESILPNALAWFQTASKTAQVVGPALGGVLYDVIGPEGVYGAATILIACSIVMTLMIRKRMPRGGRKPTDLKTLLAGLIYIWEKPIILGSIMLDLFVVLMGGVTVLFPIFAKDILDVGPSGAGLLRSAMAAGGIMAALALTNIAIERNIGVILFASVTIYGIATAVFALSENFLLSLVAMAVVGASDMVSVYIRLGLLQFATPDDMRGRVIAVNSVFTGTSNEIGDFRAGMAAAWLGAVGAALMGGIGAVVIAAAFWKAFPVLRKAQRMDGPC
jgi:MFS family permease